MRLKKLRCKTNIRKNYFSQRIINDCQNGLPAAAVCAASINVFKRSMYISKMPYTLFKKLLANFI